MNFPNVQVLSANSRSEFFGENFRWKTLVEITVEGSFLSLSSTTYSAIHGQLNNLETSLFGSPTFYSSLTVNGVNFGEGYVSSFSSSPEGTDVNDKKYTATIVIAEDGTQNPGLEGIGSLNQNFKYLESFSESSTFTKGEGVKDSYSQTISLSIIPPEKSNGLTAAKAIIQDFISGNNLTTLIAGQYQKTVKKYYEQGYDPVTNSYSFNVNYDLYTRGSGSDDNVLVIKNISIEYQSDGFIVATENGECIGNAGGAFNVRSDAASAKAKQLSDDALENLNGSYDSSKYGPLIEPPLSKSFTSVVFEGRASYSVTYTTSKELVENSGFWEFSANIETTEGGDIVGTEDGTVTGTEENNLNKDKYKKALTLFNGTVKPGIQNRVTGYVKSGAGVLKEISSSETHSEIQGTIRYSKTYTSNNSIQAEGQDFSKILTTITKDFDRNLFSTFNIIENKEVAQKQTNLLENNTTYNIVLNGRYKTTLSDYLSKAKSLIDKTQHISDVSFSFSPSEREFNLTATYFEIPS
jgi:hypothetical protein